MLRTRVIPSLLLRNGSLIKTEKFDKFRYIGDPCNTVRIFNELEVDELLLLDIGASREKREPNFDLLADIANECFMPITYGGGITTFRHARRILAIGFEKISLNNICVERPELVRELSSHFGSQSIVASVDVKKNVWGKYEVRVLNGSKDVRKDPIAYAKELEDMGVGEILITDIGREGTWAGLNLNLISSIAESVSIPVIAQGGAGTINHILEAKEAGASAIALGSMVVFQKKEMGVLVNFPDRKVLEGLL